MWYVIFALIGVAVGYLFAVLQSRSRARQVPVHVGATPKGHPVIDPKEIEERMGVYYQCGSHWCD